MFSHSSHIQANNTSFNTVGRDQYLNIQYNVAGCGQSPCYVVVVPDASFLDNHSQELANWISQLDFNEQQDAAFGKHTKGTGTWMLQSPEFTDWMNGEPRVLWCPGKRTFLSASAY